jgi:hypothetical protein
MKNVLDADVNKKQLKRKISSLYGKVLSTNTTNKNITKYKL